MILDLSAVTDGLIALLSNGWHSAPIWEELGVGAPTFTPTFTGLGPDAVREGHGPQFSLFLYHVENNNAQEAAFWAPQMQNGAAPPVAYLPHALNLYYLMSAYSEASYAQEQETMSVALRLFHGSPVVRSDAGATPAWELTLTMEHRSYDELSLLWQATTAPLRLSVVYRAAVVFLTPEEPGIAAKPVETLDATINASDTVEVSA